MIQIKSEMDKQIAEAKKRQVAADKKKRRELGIGLVVILVSIVLCSYLINRKFVQLAVEMDRKVMEARTQNMGHKRTYWQ